MMLLTQINEKARLIPEVFTVLKLSQLPSDPDWLIKCGEQSIPLIYRFPIIADCLPILSDLLGDTAVQIRTGNYADPDAYATVAGRYYETMPFSDYASHVAQGSARGYLGNHPLPATAVSRLALTIPAPLTADLFYSPRLWLGPAGSVTPLHQDGLDNLAFHLMGRKRWRLIHPRYARFLKIHQPFPKEAPNLVVSALDLRASSQIELVNQDSHAIEVLVEEGEVLFLPAGWFHFVETLSPCCMLNLWVDPARQLPLILRKDA